MTAFPVVSRCRPSALSRLMLLLLVLVMLPAAPLLATPVAPSDRMPDGAGPWVVRAYWPDRAALQLLTRRTAPWLVQPEERYVIVEVPNRYEYDQLLRAGFKAWVDPQLTRLLSEPAAIRSIPGYACYRTVEETGQRLAELAAAHPGLARIESIGPSWARSQDAQAGYELQVLVLGNQATAGPKPRMFVMGAIHAREYTTAELVLRFGEGLLADYEHDADVRWLLDRHELHLLPQANPDGRKMAEAGDLWRKNVNAAYCGATSSSRGADLNRNFPFEWGAHGGSSGNACSDVFRGAAPSSEPETQAIIDYLGVLFEDRRPDDLVSPAPEDTAGLYFDIHSFGQLVIWPWGFTESPAPNGTALATLGRRLAWFNRHRAQQAVDLYVTDGTTIDHGYGELGVASLSFELGTSFFEDCASFENTVLEPNRAALRYGLRVSGAPYLLPAGPEIESLQASLVEPGEQALFFAVADDRRFRPGSGDPEPSQRIVGGRIHEQDLQGPLVAIMAAADGSFDSEREEMLGAVDSGGRAPGRYLLVAQAEDESGARGPGIGQWLEVVSPGSTGRVTGRLRDAASGQPLSGGILRSGAYATLHGPLGHALRLQPGEHPLRGEAPGYMPAEMDAVTVIAGQDTVQDLDLLRACELLASDAESGLPPDWVATVPWAIDAEHSFSPSHSFSDSPGSDYSNGANTALLLPILDLSAISGVRLEFASRCETESGFDFGRVEYRIGAGPWTEVWQCSGTPVWESVALELPQLSGQGEAQLRFRLTSDGFQTAPGWSVDDIRLIGGSAVCPQTQPWEGFGDGFE